LLYSSPYSTYSSVTTAPLNGVPGVTTMPGRAQVEVRSTALTHAEYRLHTARRVFSLVPLVVFLLTLSLLAGQSGHSLYAFAQVLLRAMAVSLSSSIVCIAAYGFYRYLQDRSYGL
jgi:hypothetical protein